MPEHEPYSFIEKPFLPREDLLDEDLPQEGCDGPVKLLIVPEEDGAIREGDEVTKEGGEHIREELESWMRLSGSEFEFERIPVDEMKERLKLPKTEPTMGIRNAPRIIAAASMFRPRLKATLDEGIRPIVSGGDHSVALMSIPEVATRFPDPEDPQYSILRVVSVDQHGDVLSAQDIKTFKKFFKLLLKIQSNPHVIQDEKTGKTIAAANKIIQQLSEKPEQLRYRYKIEALDVAKRIFDECSVRPEMLLESRNCPDLLVALESITGVGNAHGRWGSTIHGEGPSDLMPAVQGKRWIKRENHMIVGTGQNDPPEVKYIRGEDEDDEAEKLPATGETVKGGATPVLPMMPCWSLKRFLADRMGFRRELRKLLTIERNGRVYKAPVWLEIDPDVLSAKEGGQGTGMVSEVGMTLRELEEIVALVALEGDVIGIGVAEIAPERDPDGETRQAVCRAIVRALGKGPPDYLGYNTKKAHKVTNEEHARPQESVVFTKQAELLGDATPFALPRESTPVPQNTVELERRLQQSGRRRAGIWGTLALAASVAIATIGQYFPFKKREMLPEADRAVASKDGEEISHGRRFIHNPTAVFLKEFETSGFTELARRLRYDVRSGDERHAEDVLYQLADLYVAAERSAPNLDAKSYVGQVAAGYFDDGFGITGEEAKKRGEYYQRLLQTVEERRKRMEKNG